MLFEVDFEWARFFMVGVLWRAVFASWWLGRRRGAILSRSGLSMLFRLQGSKNYALEPRGMVK
jgi:hypothetical protein